jgi:MFS family permease
VPRRAAGPKPPSPTRSLTGWLIGFGASVLADQVFFLSLTWAALQVGTPAQVGLVLAAGSVPRLLILLIGGAIADRASPKRIIVATDSGRAVVMALAAVVLMVGAMNTTGLVVVALLIGALDGLFLPAVGALPARIAPPHLMGRVAALRTVTQRVAMLAGGPLAGWMIFLYGASAAFWASAALFAVSVVALALVSTIGSAGSASGPALGPASVVDTGPTSVADASPSPVVTSASAPAVDVRQRAAAPAAPGVFARISEGLRAVRRDPVLPWLLLLIAGMNFGFAGPVTAGLPLLAAQEGWGAKGAGLLLGGFGLGATVTGLGLVFVRRIPRAGWVAMASVSAMGLALAAAGLASSLAGTIVATVVLGLASGVLGTVVHAMVLTTTPQAEIGRVMALVSLSVEGVVPLSFAATGVLAGVLGPESVFFAGGAVILLTTGLAFLRPRLRSFELIRPDDAEAAPPPYTSFLPRSVRPAIDPLSAACIAMRALR